MRPAFDQSFVTTIHERCRSCYTCVRECPAKAIQIAEGHAKILGARCIACGNCVRVCSQKAKQVVSSISDVEQLLAGPVPVIACVAPSFPAEFAGTDYTRVVGMLRELGFAAVHEVAFGADLVSRAYAKLLKDSPSRRFIATTCPAAVGYIERYYPHLVDVLVPIVSPMVATARALRKLNSDEMRIVFIGPCIAKKVEAGSQSRPQEIDAVLTFAELREMLAAHEVTEASASPSEFDPPHPARGVLYGIKRGMLQAAGLDEDLLAGQTIAAHGRVDFVNAIEEFDSGQLETKFLEVLCCRGCIMGPGMSKQMPMFHRHSQVGQYVRQRMARYDAERWAADMQELGDVDLRRTYQANDQRIPLPSKEELQQTLCRLGKLKPEDELNCGACGYDTCVEHAIAIHRHLAENEMCLPYTIERLHQTIKELAHSQEQLDDTREALHQSEKLATMGQLAAGVAHEINNPLGVVLMYAHLLLEGINGEDPLHKDLAMIAQQADRCKKIVSELLNFARESKVLYQTADLKDLVERSLHNVPAPANIAVNVMHELEDTACEVDPDQIAQVLTNLIDNAFAAMPNGGTLTVRTHGSEQRVALSVQDTGVGIPKEIIGKIFEPFFTTKQIGLGTGLGLAVTYGIVKAHSGDISVKSNADPAAGPTGTTFTVNLPRRPNSQ
ncbi:MAG TPA: [Fe-Fe] hydrogenase large subunit C-terminal domain-containing protein [Planctomycetota bacterium]|jgi:signal transduction histidine kinase/iron only hydrogenase large subunit-like protein